MTEPRIDVGGPDIDETFERTPADIFSEDLIKFLGGEAAQATLLATTINTMPGRNRHNAMLALSSLVLALESAADEPIDLRYLVDEQLGKRRMHVVAEKPVEADADLVAGEPVVLETDPHVDGPQQRDVTSQVSVDKPKRELTDSQLASRPLKYLLGYFDISLVDKLTPEHIPALAHAIVGRYYKDHPKKKIPQEQREAEMAAYLVGKSDEEIAEAYVSTAPAVQVGRSVIFTELRKTLVDVNQLLVSVLDENEADDELADFVELDVTNLEVEPIDELIEVTLGEQAEGVVYDRTDVTTNRIEEILAENGVIAEESTKEELSLRDKVLIDVLELWGDKEPLIKSYEALLTEEQVGPASASARQELKDLMEKYAPRWMQKLGISQHPWQLTRNVLGSDRKPISVQQANRQYRGRLALAKTTAEDEFLQIVGFLLSKQLAGAPAEPKAHHAKPGHRSFKKGQKK
ncbi:MAG: hypothetical protein U0491_00595 [Candidatus Saccharimonadales bacterium]